MQIQLALVTGATSGIGFALCHLLAEKGIHLIATGRSLERLQELKNNLNSKIDLSILAVDLANKAERAKLIELIQQKKPNLVINNAGFGLYGEALTYTKEEQELILEVNGHAVLELTLESARVMLSNHQPGIILNVSSAAAFQIFPSFAIYSATKAFVNHFSQSLDYEFRPYGIRVLVACPGMVDTQFQQHAAGAENRVTKKMNTMSATEVAQLIWQQIQQQNPLVIMNWKYRLLTALTKLIPQRWLASLLSRTIQARINPRKIIKTKK